MAPHEAPLPLRIDLVKSIVNIEGPIHQDEVARRLSKGFGLERSGSRIKDATLEALIAADGLCSDNQFWFICGSSLSVVRSRAFVTNKTLEKAEYLPPSEIFLALRLIVRGSVRINQDELVQQVTRVLGFKRCGSELKSVIEDVLSTEIGKSFLREGDIVYLFK
jgi:hypothetical protein